MTKVAPPKLGVRKLESWGYTVVKIA